MHKTQDGTHWIPDTDTFAARLALVRREMGWNIREAERECGISQNLWSNWEAGSAPRDQIKVSEKISKRTGVDLVWLMLGAQRQPSDYKVEVSRPRKSRPANRADQKAPKGRAKA